MAMYIDKSRFEFELTVKRFGPKESNEMRYGYPTSVDEKSGKIEEELKEKLEFKSLSALEVLRKLLDYLESR